jgi:GntR family transcriptional regulator
VVLAAFSPLYRQVKSLITEDLRVGLWKPGDMIPSEVELAARHGVSQGTVRRAIEELTAENLLIRQQGRGTFVASHLSPRSQFRFLRLRRDDQLPLVPASEVLECKRMRGPIEVARQLQIRVGEPVVMVRRLLRVEQEPAVLEDIWLPGARFKGLSAERLSAYHGPLYGLFESDFGTRMIRATEAVRAVEAPTDVARILAVKAASPVLLVERLSFTYQDMPVEVRVGYYLTKVSHYFNELS